jgi:hypothetical protein
MPHRKNTPAGEENDTEGNAAKWRGQGEADGSEDTEGNAAKAGRIEDAGEDTEGHKRQHRGVEDAGDDDADGHRFSSNIGADFDDTEESEDTEGNALKWRGVEDAGETEGHGAKPRFQGEADGSEDTDTEGHRRKFR